jgi:nucleoid-associated protein YgaU
MTGKIASGRQRFGKPSVNLCAIPLRLLEAAEPEVVMGLFNFIKSAGRLIGLGGQDAVQDESKPAPPPPAAEAIRTEMERLGLPAQGMEVRVEGDTVRISGAVPDAATREKLILAAGNVAGIAKVEETISTAVAATAEPVFYTVAKGDTLSAIAKQHYGNANKYQAIFEANRPMLKDPDKIYPGQVLRIPPQP